MPANLSPEYKQAEERFRAAKTPEERLVGLEEMLSAIPKHKGTEKMQADLKTRIAKVRKELTQKKGPKRADWFHVEKQGAGQAAVVGAPNSGKSALVRQLTGLPAVVAPYPFATTVPAAGMMPFEDVQIQLIDTPPVHPDSPAWLYHIFRTADVLLLLFDLSDDALLETAEQVQSLLLRARIAVGPARPSPPEPEVPCRRALRIGSKCDASGAQERLLILEEFLTGRAPSALPEFGIRNQESGPGLPSRNSAPPVLPVSADTGQGLDDLKRAVFQELQVTRVYTKKPGKPPDFDDPVLLPNGSTVLDAAYHLHKDIAAGLSFARLWNAQGYEGQRVERGHVVQDKDILEFHT